MTTLLISAGDASGDLHAADFARAFRRRRPDARIVGLGGEAMQRAGVEILVPGSDLAVGGVFELALHLPRIHSVWSRMDRALRKLRPDLVVLVDSGGFNIPFARRVQRRCGAKILYFVAPQVWAWRPRRIAKLAARVDRMALILPFESEVYAQSPLAVEYVGHPLADAIEPVDRSAARRRFGCADGQRVVAVFPGSRRNEVTRQLPVQLEACRLLRGDVPGLRVLIACAPSVERAALERAARRARDVEFEIIEGNAREVMAAADVALAKPGTVTVELALLARPMVVVGRVNPLTAAILKRLVRVPFYAMPNLVAGREIVPEFLQQAAEPAAIARALARLLDGPAREEQLKNLAQVRTALARGGAAERASELAEEMLGDALA